MKKYKKLVFVIVGILALMLAACAKDAAAPETAAPAPETAAPATGGLLGQPSANGSAEYAGYQFSGPEPWGGTLTITIVSIHDGAMDWSFTDSFEGHTLYQVQRETALSDGTASFDVQGKDVEHENVSFAYQGTLELKDGKLTVSFHSGAVTEEAAEGSSVYHDVASLSDSANQVVLDRTADGPYMIYTVQSGDSVHSIATAHGISTKDLCILNQIVIIETAKAHGYEFDDVTEYAKYLFPGEELLVPMQ